MKKYGFLILMLLITVSCNNKNTGSIQKDIERINLLSDYPMPLTLIEWQERAQAYDALVFGSEEGEFLPLSQIDDRDNLSMLAYVGDFRSFNGGQEAINVFAALLSGSYVGIDKSAYLDHLEGFFNRELGLFTNNVGGKTGETFWYELFPNILFAKLVATYPDYPNHKERLKTVVDNWEKVAKAMIQTQSIEFTAYDFANEELIVGNWLEPDAAIGIAYLLLVASDLLMDTSYVESAYQLMLIVDALEWNPFYEVLSAYGPYVASRLNVEKSAHFNVSKYFDWLVNGDSYVRPGWGIMQGRWGDYDVSGLVGNTSDAGGFAFSMNTFAVANAIQEVALYDSRYANVVGKWLYNIVYNSRFFYRDGLPEKHQFSGAEFQEDQSFAIPFEGLRYREQERTPMATGDAVKHSWAATNYSLYSGSYSGFIANMPQNTEHTRVLRFLLKEADGVGSYLYYNASPDNVTVTIASEEKFDIVETTQNKVLAQKTSHYELELEAKSAKIIHIIPQNVSYQLHQGTLKINGTYRASQVPLALNIKGFPLVGSISGLIDIEIDVKALAKVKNLSIILNDDEIYSGTPLTTYTLDSTQFPNGHHYITFMIEDDKGNKDRVEKSFFIFNSGADGALFSLAQAVVEDFEAISLMPGFIYRADHTWVVQERNEEGHWGGVMITLDRVDFDRQPMVMIGIDHLTSMWGLKIVLHDDTDNPWGFYLKGDNSESGLFTIDLLNALRSYHPNLLIDGVHNIDVWLFSVGEEDGFVAINQLEIFYLQ